MAEELGTFPPAQAMVVMRALQDAGLTPEARRTRAGIVVTVPDDQSGRAQRTLADNMDAIARAAVAPGVRRSRAGAGSGDGRPLATERLLSVARPLAVLLVALMVLTVVGRFQPLLAIVGVGAAIYFLGRRAQDRGEGPR